MPVYNTSGSEVDTIELDESVFGVEPNESVVHQALVRQFANARVGSAESKRRGEVSGSTRKLYRQKHTGYARAGSRRSPTRRGGGVALGPHMRSYRQAMPKKMRRLALKCVLSSKLAQGDLKVVDSFGLTEPKTSQIASALRTLEVPRSALLVTADKDENVVKSVNNIEKTRALAAGMLNVGDLLAHQKVVMSVDAVRRVEEIWGSRGAAVEAGEA